jgi:hypothetical protein
MENMYYVGLDVHKKTISYCVKDGSGRIYAAGSIPATRLSLDLWMKTLPQPWTVAMEATIFTAWIGSCQRSCYVCHFRVARNRSRIDAKHGDHFLQAMD